MKDTIKALNNRSHELGINISALFENMLDFFLDTFDPRLFIKHKGNLSAVFKEREQEDQYLLKLLIHWLEQAESKTAENEIYDFFGELYESMFLGKSKVSAMGQFFTPVVLSQTMANLAKGSAKKVFEPSCGSGRNVLAHWSHADKTQPPYYICVDLDPISAKMCALNMLIAGMIGEVICKDALDVSGAFHFCYLINEIRWPLPTMFYSARRILPTKIIQQ